MDPAGDSPHFVPMPRRRQEAESFGRHLAHRVDVWILLFVALPLAAGLALVVGVLLRRMP